jgi:hypothetical protein
MNGAGWWWNGGAGAGEGAARVEPAELPRQVLRVQPVHGRAGAHGVLRRAVRAGRAPAHACPRGASRGGALQLQAGRVEVPVPRPRLRALTSDDHRALPGCRERAPLFALVDLPGRGRPGRPNTWPELSSGV